jgi:hypothetical protein
MRQETTWEAAMKQRAFRGDKVEEARSGRLESSRARKRTRLFSQLAHDRDYEGEDVHLGSEAITVYAI